MLNNIKLQGVNFQLVSSELEEFDISYNKNIDDMKFLNELFNQATKLKKLALKSMQLTAEKINTIDFSYLSHTLEELDISFNVITDIKFLNIIFEKVPKLKKIDMTQCSLSTELIEKIIFAHGLKEIIIDKNSKINLADVIVNIGETKGMQLEYFSAKYIENKEPTMAKKYDQYSFNGKLQGFSNLQKLHIQQRQFTDERYVNLILSNNNSGLTDIMLSDIGLNEQQFKTITLKNVYQNLEILDLSFGYSFGSFGFLKEIFEKSLKLKVLNLNWCFVGQNKLSLVKTVPETLEEFFFTGNQINYSNIQIFLNQILSRCQRLKVLHLDKCNLRDADLKDIKWTQISTNLVDLNISNNPDINTYYFLNDIFRRATSLKKINLEKNKIGKAVDQINFDLLNKTIEVFIADEDDFYNEEFQDYLINKFERYINIYNFQQKNQNILNFQYINYFCLFEQQNLSLFRLIKNSITDSKKKIKNNKSQNLKNSNNQEEQDEEFYKHKSYLKDEDENLDQVERKIIEKKLKKERAQNEEELQRQQKKEKTIQYLKNNKADLVENSKDVKYTQQINPLYFYTYFSKLNQLISERDQNEYLRKPKNEQNTITNFEKTIEYQNVYINKCYKLLELININSIKAQQLFPEKSKNTSLDYDFYFPYLNELNLANQNYPNLEFLSFFLMSGQYITTINMSNMDLKLENVENVRIQRMGALIDVNFSGSKCTYSNIFGFVNNILQSAPNLIKLNLSNMDMNGNCVCNFNVISEKLQELNISANKHIPTLSILNGLFLRCQQLLVLNISKTGLNNNKLGSTYFGEISRKLYVFDCSDNNELKTIEFINEIILNCRNLIKLNLSNCNINDETFRFIRVHQLGTIKELDISKNLIYGCMNIIFEVCFTIEKFDMSGQQFNGTLYNIENYKFQKQNSLRDFDFSGNIAYYYYDFICSMINQSKNFCRLTIQQVNLTQNHFEFFRFEEIGHKILELDISNNDNLEDITQINHLHNSPDFSVFIAKYTSLNNTLMNQINISEVFKNLRKLDLSGCHNFVTFISQIKYFCQLLNQNIQIYQEQQIDFKNTPVTLKEFDFSQNKFIKNFEFLNKLFQVTNDSLIYINLSECDLNEEKLQQEHFSLLGNKIEQINLEKNENLDKIDFLNVLFDNYQDFKLKKLKISKINYQIAKVLQKYANQIEEVESAFKSFDIEFFSQKQFKANINFNNLYRHLISDQKFLKKNSSQQLKQRKDPKYFLLKQFLKTMMEYISQRKSLQTIQHFFFLLLNEYKIQSNFYESEFFIMSPYFLFQQPQEIQCVYDKQKNLIMDSYNLVFFDLNLLNRETDYIFGYDRFFFPEFPDFYVQQLDKTGSDLRFIIELNKKMGQLNIQNAFLPIRLTLTQEILKEYRLNEYQVLYLISSIPPAVLNLKGMSIQFVKSWYAINFYAPLSVQTIIDVDYDLLENSSIANFLTLRSYSLYVRNFERKSFLSKIKYFIGKLSYSFFNILSSQPQKFNFDHTVIHLENQIKEYINKGWLHFLRVIFPFYIFICIFGVWFFSFRLEISCGNGISWYSYITYAVFGFITFFIEAFIFKSCLKYVSHLVPELKPDCRISFPYPLINSIKLFIMDINWINQWYVNYFVSFILSQISRFDFFTNIGFLFTVYQCGDMLIFTLAFISLSITTFTCLIFFIWNFMGDNSYDRLVTGQIDKLYQICNLLEFQAVADVLDIISPSNSIIIFDKMFNQRIVNNFIRILLQDIPYIIIQVFYLIHKGDFNRSMIFSLVSSGIMFLVTLHKFLSITPSRLGQEDFNYLNTIKKRNVLPNYLNKLSKYESQIVKFNQYEILKCIRSSTYFQDRLSKNTNLSEEEKEKQLQMAQELRSFQPNKDFMNDVFGNLENADVSINSLQTPNQKDLTLNDDDSKQQSQPQQFQNKNKITTIEIQSNKSETKQIQQDTENQKNSFVGQISNNSLTKKIYVLGQKEKENIYSIQSFNSDQLVDQETEKLLEQSQGMSNKGFKNEINQDSKQEFNEQKSDQQSIIHNNSSKTLKIEEKEDDIKKNEDQQQDDEQSDYNQQQKILE